MASAFDFADPLTLRYVDRLFKVRKDDSFVATRATLHILGAKDPESRALGRMALLRLTKRDDVDRIKTRALDMLSKDTRKSILFRKESATAQSMHDRINQKWLKNFVAK